jgi:hypothetical protein
MFNSLIFPELFHVLQLSVPSLPLGAQLHSYMSTVRESSIGAVA